jgi:hypothetical protein
MDIPAEPPLLRLDFDARIIEWRGPAPFLFAPVPAEHADAIRWAARQASYGWGCVPVDAAIGDTGFYTALIPRAGIYMLPVKVAVQRSAGVALGDAVSVTLAIRPR